MHVFQGTSTFFYLTSILFFFVFLFSTASTFQLISNKTVFSEFCRTSICLFSLASEQSRHAMLKAERPTHTHTHTHTHIHARTHSVLICLSDSAVSETGCQREGIYYRIDLAMQLGGNGNFSFHFSLCNGRLSGAL